MSLVVALGLVAFVAVYVMALIYFGGGLRPRDQSDGRALQTGPSPEDETPAKEPGSE